VLLVAAGLLLTSFARLQRVAPGFNPNGIFAGQLNISPTKYRGEKLPVFYQQLYQRLRVMPGVKAAAMSDRVPLTGNGTPAPVAVEGRPLLPMGERASANRHLITPGFFATLEIPFRQGRDFNERDIQTTPHVVIVNEAFVKQHFPNENPIGRRLITGMAQIPSEIVGVVADYRGRDLNTPPEPDYFLPALQRPENFSSILLRTEGDPATYAGAVRAVLKELDGDLPLLNPQPLVTLIAQNIADRRLIMNLLAGFAGLALLLASIGIYSVMAYMVSQRTSEIGIRMALGASGGDVLRMVVGQGMRLAGIGIALGLLGALGLTRILQQQLFEVKAHDPVVYAVIALIIGAVAALACFLPARRAARTDPMIALRAE
jgi:putative ABC transport system permease protein